MATLSIDPRVSSRTADFVSSNHKMLIDGSFVGAVQHANDTIYGLAASVWTQSMSVAHKVARGLRAGTVWVNCHNVFDASLPFGGYKQSGWGREMGDEVLNNYLETKAVTIAL
jgi:phenylacetaldehyde dehydrogenase